MTCNTDYRINATLQAEKITGNVLFYAAIRLRCGASSVTGDCGYTARLATKRYVS